MILTAPTIITTPRWRLPDWRGLLRGPNGHLARSRAGSINSGGHLVNCEPERDYCTDIPISATALVSGVDATICEDCFLKSSVFNYSYKSVAGNSVDGLYNSAFVYRVGDSIFIRFLFSPQLEVDEFISLPPCTPPPVNTFGRNFINVGFDCNTRDVVSASIIVTNGGADVDQVFSHYFFEYRLLSSVKIGSPIPNEIDSCGYVSTDDSIHYTTGGTITVNITA